MLRRVYISDPAPSMTKCQYMSEETGLRINTIKTWFREKRCRDRKFFERDEKLAYGKLPLFLCFLCVTRKFKQSNQSHHFNKNMKNRFELHWQKFSQFFMTVLIFMLFVCLSFNCLKCLCISDPAREFFAWLETALSPNCVPPNVELTPDAIRNGEVLLTNVSHTASITYPRFPTRSIHRHWLACNTS